MEAVGKNMKKFRILFLLFIILPAIFFCSRPAEAYLYPGSIVTLQEPINRVTTSLAPTFKFTAYTYSSYGYFAMITYGLSVCTASNVCSSFSLSGSYRSLSCSGTNPTICQPTNYFSILAPDTNYTWSVTVCDPSSCVASARAAFKTGSLPSAPNLISPADGANDVFLDLSQSICCNDDDSCQSCTQVAVNLTWQDVGANYYIVYSQHYYNDYSFLSRVGQTTFGVTNLAMQAWPNTTYQWYVYACNNNVGDEWFGSYYPGRPLPLGECIRSASWSFTTKETARAPEGVATVGPTRDSMYVERYWFSKSCARYCYYPGTLYVVYLERKVSDAVDAATLFTDSCSSRNIYESCPFNLVAGIHYHWRVMACNGANCAYSPYAEFTRTGGVYPTTTVISPVNHAVIQTATELSTVNFSWTLYLDPFYGSPVMRSFNYYDGAWHYIPMSALSTTLNLSNGTYQWFIESCRLGYTISGGDCGRSEIYNFTIMRPPSVTTETAVVDILNNRAILKGNISVVGSDGLYRYIDWDTDASGEPYVNTIDLGSGGVGIYSTTINMTPGTIYYYRAKAVNSAGNSAGVEKKAAIYTAEGDAVQFIIVPPNSPPRKPVPEGGGGGVTWDNCTFKDISIPTFHWSKFSDPDKDDYQTVYEIRIDDNAGFPKNPDSAEFVASGTIGSSYAPTDRIDEWADWMSWNKNYWWIVRVKDNHNNWSEWSDANLSKFASPAHAYPYPGFSWLPEEPNQKEVVVFDPDATDVYYLWTFNQGALDTYEPTDDTSETDEEPHIKFLTSANTVKLKVTDKEYDYFCESQPFTGTLLEAQLPLPEYKEVPPMMWFKNFFSGLASAAWSLFLN
ncbi:MAG: hypothetical protein ABH841_02985 [Candidatus Nealsonbacteria bacterium]